MEKIIQGEEIQISSTKAASDGSASFTAVLTEPTDWKRIEKVLAQLKMCLKCTSEPVAYVIEDFSK